MKTAQLLQLMSVAAISVLLTSCIDSKVPLSDPAKSKPDERLLGVWRFRGEGGDVNYYHVGRAGEKAPASVMRVVTVQHSSEGKVNQGELFAFPTALGDKTYLNVAEISPSQLKMLEENGWTDNTANAYLILRYQVKGDSLTLQLMDGEARKRAIEAGKIKGVIEKDQNGNARGIITDTPENIAKFVASAGDGLYSKDVLRLERVK